MGNQGNLVLLLGSNSGNSKQILEKSISLIESKLDIVVEKSAVYKSKSWGFTGNDFLNQALVIKTNKHPIECLNITQEIERELGRHKKSTNGKYENRIIDVDILFYDDELIESEELNIPHPRIQDRRFTLVPLNDLMPEFLHPKLNQPISELIEKCADQNEVKKLNG